VVCQFRSKPATRILPPWCPARPKCNWYLKMRTECFRQAEPLWQHYNVSCFTHEETEAQWGQVSCPRCAMGSQEVLCSLCLPLTQQGNAAVSRPQGEGASEGSGAHSQGPGSQGASCRMGRRPAGWGPFSLDAPSPPAAFPHLCCPQLHSVGWEARLLLWRPAGVENLQPKSTGFH
jgi:hypothetical protein